MAESIVSAGTQSHLLNQTEIDELWLVESATPTVSIVTAYLIFTLWLGPSIMADRKPFELKGVLQVYNLLQVASAIYILAQPFLLDGIMPSYTSPCRPPGSPLQLHPNMAYLIWLYFMAKIADLLDTVFIVLRKKDRQISFLHFYHHVTILVGSWAYLKYIQDSSLQVGQMLNTGVHLIMYTYYFIAALGPKYAKYIWWKKHLTKIQLTQFGIANLYMIWLVVNGCECSRGWVYFTLSAVGLLTILFGNFYLQTYLKARKEK